MQVLLDRLAAQELMLLQRPVISGRYSPSPFVNMLSGPLDEALRPLFSTLVHMGELVHSILCEEPESGVAQLSQLEKVIQDLDSHRYTWFLRQSQVHVSLETVTHTCGFQGNIEPAANMVHKYHTVQHMHRQKDWLL